jgi:ABC-type multidrug transport system fused ATPase/permease subunit
MFFAPFRLAIVLSILRYTAFCVLFCKLLHVFVPFLLAIDCLSFDLQLFVYYFVLSILRFTAFCVLFCKFLHVFVPFLLAIVLSIVRYTATAVYRRIDNTMAKGKGTKTCNNLQNNTQKAVYRTIDNTMAKRKGTKNMQ